MSVAITQQKANYVSAIIHEVDARRHNRSSVVLTIKHSSVVDGLKFKFWGFILDNERRPNTIDCHGVLARCDRYTPSGFDTSDDGMSLTVYYKANTDIDALHYAKRSLTERINEACADMDAKYRHNPMTQLIEPR